MSALLPHNSWWEGYVAALDDVERALRSDGVDDGWVARVRAKFNLPETPAQSQPGEPYTYAECSDHPGETEYPDSGCRKCREELDVRVIQDSLVRMQGWLRPGTLKWSRDGLDALGRIQARVAELEGEIERWKDDFKRKGRGYDAWKGLCEDARRERDEVRRERDEALARAASDLDSGLEDLSENEKDWLAAMPVWSNLRERAGGASIRTKYERLLARVAELETREERFRRVARTALDAYEGDRTESQAFRDALAELRAEIERTGGGE